MSRDARCSGTKKSLPSWYWHCLVGFVVNALRTTALIPMPPKSAAPPRGPYESALLALALGAFGWACLLLRRCRLWCDRRASSHRNVKYGTLASTEVQSLDAAEDELLSELGSPRGDERFDGFEAESGRTARPSDVQWL